MQELNCPALLASLLLLTGEVQNTFKTLYFGLNFQGDLAKGKLPQPLVALLLIYHSKLF